MNEKIIEIARRILGLRELTDTAAGEIAIALDITIDEYDALEQGASDYSFTTLYKIANFYKIDITEILTGENPKLRSFCCIRAGEGLPIERRKGFVYQNMAYLFHNKAAEPFVVTAPACDDGVPIALGSHTGQEFDYILSGRLRFQIDGHVMTLSPGDMVYYDAQRPHGMNAEGGQPCVFLATVIKTPGGEEEKR